MSEKSQKTSRAMRDSNIELFRIITMIMIVAHHYVVCASLCSQFRINGHS